MSGTDTDDEDAWAQAAATSDTEAAIASLDARFGGGGGAGGGGAQAPGTAPCVATLAAVRATLSDGADGAARAAAAAELEGLRRANKVRQFALALAGTSEDYALRRTADYERDLRSAAEATESAAARAAAQRFVARVLPRCTGLCVTESELEEAMAGREGQGGNAAAEDVTQLLSLGALARRLDFDRSRAYWFALPGRGGALKALADGRAELGQWLKRRKFHEALRKDSVKVRLKRARLPAEFVVYDMLGAGLLLSVPTPSGEAVRLSRKALATTVSSAARRRR